MTEMRDLNEEFPLAHPTPLVPPSPSRVDPQAPQKQSHAPTVANPAQPATVAHVAPPASTLPSLLGKRNVMTREQLRRKNVAQLKAMCRSRGLLVGGRKAQLIDRLINPDAPSAKRRRTAGRSRGGGGSRRVDTINRRLKELGVADPSQVSSCLRRGMQRQFVDIFTDEGLDHVFWTSTCPSCKTVVKCVIRDFLHQSDYGGDYEEGSEGGGFECKECSCQYYVTRLCEGRFSFDSGKFHNHCTECSGLGKCIGDYREAHCSNCGKHYFCGLSGMPCSCQERGGRGDMFGFGGGMDGGGDEDCAIQ